MLDDATGGSTGSYVWHSFVLKSTPGGEIYNSSSLSSSSSSSASSSSSSSSSSRQSDRALFSASRTGLYAGSQYTMSVVVMAMVMVLYSATSEHNNKIYAA